MAKCWRTRLLELGILLSLVLLFHLFSGCTHCVESYYSGGIYVAISTILSFIFGWIPFSLGDLIYAFVVGYLLYLFACKVRLLFRRRFSRKRCLQSLYRGIRAFLIIYLIFYLFWGLNYSRKPLYIQLELETPEYDSAQLAKIEQILHDKVNESKRLLIAREISIPRQAELFHQTHKIFERASVHIPLLNPSTRLPSLKGSLFSRLASYAGVTGYYNPFTGEAQINTDVPYFLQPYILAHEYAHQLGFAKEYEASFVGYLAAVKADDPVFQYSAYLDLYLYTNRELYYLDSAAATQQMKTLTAPVQADIAAWRAFNRKYSGVTEVLSNRFYAAFLRWNKQPEGMRSYNMVVHYLMAYYQKWGVVD